MCIRDSVWLAACLLVRSVDESLSHVLIQQYHADRARYEWLNLFNKGAPDNRTLFNYLQWTTECYYSLKKVTSPDPQNITLTKYILEMKSSGLLVAILVDTNGNSTHTIGINLEKKRVYDCQEKHILPLSVANLSICCGPNKTFNNFGTVG